jgi:hypothetical protein
MGRQSDPHSKGDQDAKQVGATSVLLGLRTDGRSRTRPVYGAGPPAADIP